MVLIYDLNDVLTIPSNHEPPFYDLLEKTVNRRAVFACYCIANLEVNHFNTGIQSDLLPTNSWPVLLANLGC